MSQTVNAAEAAQLAHVTERTVRSWLASGKLEAAKVHTPGQPLTWAIDTDTLAEAIGRKIDAEALARIGASRPTVGRLEALEREVSSLRARIRTLEALVTSLRVSGGHQTAIEPSDDAPYHPPTYRPSGEPPARSYSMSYAPSATAATFRTRADAARWLMRHGIASEGTPKSWHGWQDVELEPRPVLELALSLCDVTNHRITWRLRQCDDSACVCRELLASGAS